MYRFHSVRSGNPHMLCSLYFIDDVLIASHSNPIEMVWIEWIVLISLFQLSLRLSHIISSFVACDVISSDSSWLEVENIPLKCIMIVPDGLQENEISESPDQQGVEHLMRGWIRNFGDQGKDWEKEEMKGLRIIKWILIAERLLWHHHMINNWTNRRHVFIQIFVIEKYRAVIGMGRRANSMAPYSRRDWTSKWSTLIHYLDWWFEHRTSHCETNWLSWIIRLALTQVKLPLNILRMSHWIVKALDVLEFQNHNHYNVML
jgi:hypothetical protein